MAVLSLAGLAWIVAAKSYHRKLREVTASLQGKARGGPGWTTPEAAARWERWVTAVAVAVPVGYATNRYVWHWESRWASISNFTTTSATASTPALG